MPVVMNADGANATSATLLLRLRDLSDQEAWNDFVDRYAPQIFRWCRQNSLQDSDASDVTQEVLGKLVSAMRSFDYQPNRGSFRGWLKTVTTHAVSDLGRRWERRVRGSGDTNVHAFLYQLCDPQQLGDLSAHIERQFQAELLAEAESRVRLRVKPQTWQAFRLCTHGGLSAKQVSQQIGLSISEVYVAKSRVIKHLREEIGRLNCDR